MEFIQNSDENAIKWRKEDESLRLAYNERIENSQRPSIWEYNPKGGMPKELANLESSTFLISSLGRILCSLPKDVLIRLCSTLSACDFVHLSMPCRFLRWRMFTFCTCYVPYSVVMRVHDDRISVDSSETTDDVPPKLIYTLGVTDGEECNDDNIESGPGAAASFQQWSRLVGQRGLFVYQPFCLRRPFFFDKLTVALHSPFYYKQFYDRCLPYILAVRGLARHLDVSFTEQFPYLQKFAFIFSDTNAFFKMSRVIAVNLNGQNRLNVPVFESSIGVYQKPLDSAIKATLKNFLSGSTNLIYHQYLDIEENDGRFPLIAYLCQEFGEFKAYLCKFDDTAPHDRDYHAWKKVVATENGGQLRITFKKNTHQRNDYWSKICLTIGKEEMFDEMEKKCYGEWRELKTDEDPDEIVDEDDCSSLFEEWDEDEELTEESDVDETSNETE